MISGQSEPSPSTTNRTSTAGTGSAGPGLGTQAYILAVFCLLPGVALGFLFRGSASPASTNPTAQQGSVSRPQSPAPAAADVQTALAQAAAPLRDAVNKNPDGYDSLVKLGNVLYDGQQYPSAIQFYERALGIHPENPDVRTDMATAYWYTGNADKAIAVMQTSLKYRPGRPQTLFNLRWVCWQGKADPAQLMGHEAEWLKPCPSQTIYDTSFSKLISGYHLLQFWIKSRM